MKRTRLRPVSSKRSAQNAEYLKRRKAFLEAHPYCQWWLAQHNIPEETIINGFVRDLNGRPIFIPKSNQIHHKKGRTGMMLVDTRYWMAVSDDGHKWIHKFTGASYEKEYLLPRNRLEERGLE